MSLVAYQLREEFAGYVVETDADGTEVETDRPKFEGGLIAVPDGEREFDTRAALDAGDGTIVVDDTDRHLTTALDTYHALERVKTPEGASTTVGYGDLKKPQLVELARQRGLDTSGTKDELVARLEGRPDENGGDDQ